MKIWNESLGPEVNIKLPYGPPLLTVPSHHIPSLPTTHTHFWPFQRGTFNWINYLLA